MCCIYIDKRVVRGSAIPYSEQQQQHTHTHKKKRVATDPIFFSDVRKNNNKIKKSVVEKEGKVLSFLSLRIENSFRPLHVHL